MAQQAYYTFLLQSRILYIAYFCECWKDKLTYGALLDQNLQFHLAVGKNRSGREGFKKMEKENKATN